MGGTLETKPPSARALKESRTRQSKPKGLSTDGAQERDQLPVKDLRAQHDSNQERGVGSLLLMGEGMGRGFGLFGIFQCLHGRDGNIWGALVYLPHVRAIFFSLLDWLLIRKIRRLLW
jgi:hypothetical protein